MSYGAHYQSKQVICLLVHSATTHSIQLFNSFSITMAKVVSLELFGHETWCIWCKVCTGRRCWLITRSNLTCTNQNFIFTTYHILCVLFQLHQCIFQVLTDTLCPLSAVYLVGNTTPMALWDIPMVIEVSFHWQPKINIFCAHVKVCAQCTHL